MYDMLVTEFQTQRKEEQVSHDNSEVIRKLVQTRESDINSEAYIQNIVSTMRRKVGGKRIHLNVTSSHMDNMSFQSEANAQKWKYVFQRMIGVERERERQREI